MDYHKQCEECVLSGECLLQDNNDVDECDDVRKAELEEEE